MTLGAGLAPHRPRLRGGRCPGMSAAAPPDRRPRVGAVGSRAADLPGSLALGPRSAGRRWWARG